MLSAAIGRVVQLRITALGEPPTAAAGWDELIQAIAAAETPLPGVAAPVGRGLGFVVRAACVAACMETLPSMPHHISSSMLLLLTARLRRRRRRPRCVCVAGGGSHIEAAQLAGRGGGMGDGTGGDATDDPGSGAPRSTEKNARSAQLKSPGLGMHAEADIKHLEEIVSQRSPRAQQWRFWLAPWSARTPR